MAESSHLWSPGRSPAHRPLEHGADVRRQRQQAAGYVSACQSGAPRVAAGPGPASSPAPAAAAGVGLLRLLARWPRSLGLRGT